MRSRAVVLPLVKRLVEVRVDILGQGAILEAIGGSVILGQRVHLHLVGLVPQVVVEGSVLPSALALVPIVNLFVAHPGGHFLLLDAVRHPLHEGVAGMRLHVY